MRGKTAKRLRPRPPHRMTPEERRTYRDAKRAFHEDKRERGRR